MWGCYDLPSKKILSYNDDNSLKTIIDFRLYGDGLKKCSRYIYKDNGLISKIEKYNITNKGRIQYTGHEEYQYTQKGTSLYLEQEEIFLVRSASKLNWRLRLYGRLTGKYPEKELEKKKEPEK